MDDDWGDMDMDGDFIVIDLGDRGDCGDCGDRWDCFIAD